MAIEHTIYASPGLPVDGARRLLGIDGNGDLTLNGGGAGPLEVTPTGSSTPRTLADIAANLYARQTAPEVAFLGDSRIASGYGDSDTQKVIFSQGPTFWAESLSRGRIRCPLDLNFGVASDTTAEVLARAPAAVASRASIIVLLAGVNDAAEGVPFETTRENIDAIVGLCLDSGKLLIIIPELPASNFTGDTTLRHLRTAEYYRRFADTHGVFVADPWLDVCDPLDSGADWLSGLSLDGTHLGSYGAYWVGQRIAAILSTIYPEPTNLLLSSNADLYDATQNPSGNFLTNGMLDGTTGTDETGATGDFATSWRGRAATDLAVAGSKVTSSFTGRPMQEIEVTGTAPASSATGIFYQNLPSTLAAGDVVEAVCEYEIDAGASGVAPPYLRCVFVGDTTIEAQAGRSSSSAIADNIPAIAYRGILRTPPITVPTGSLSTKLVSISFTCLSGNSGAYTARFGSISCRKIG